MPSRAESRTVTRYASGTIVAPSSPKRPWTGARAPGSRAPTRSQWPKLSPGGANVNATTPERDADLGGSPTFHDNRVEVELVSPGSEHAELESAAAPA